ncbi:MAG TPA: sensor domain-containing protein [Steroidobacteraceae bacterium]|nr:sensor domain-containing protein [Steroidobacteraceae bacterium]
MNAPRSIDDYLKQLRGALAGEDPALIQDALYDAEEYLRAELAAHPGKSEADVLELISSTYGAPDEVAAAYRDTERKVNAALKTPTPKVSAGTSTLARIFGIYLDPRAYSSLFYMLLTIATGIAYFTFVVVGLSLSLGLAILIIGVPFFLAFIAMARVIALGEGRLLEAITGERMPRRPLHPGAPATWGSRILDMLKDLRTWTTLAYLLLMLPLGIVYFTVAVTVLALSAAFISVPLALLGDYFGWIRVDVWDHVRVQGSGWGVDHPFVAGLLMFLAGVVLLTLFMHAARALMRGHALLAKSLLVKPGA